jgi:hypothetical protein
MTASPARAGAVAGWLTLLGILVFELIVPTLIAGQRVTATIDAGQIRAFYAHDALAPLVSLGVFAIVLAFIPFAVAIWTISEDEPRRRFLATVGLGFAVAAAPLYVAKSALAATLVTLAPTSSDPVPLFRFWDVLYNGGIYPLEAGWVLGLGLAIGGREAAPRWLGAISIVVAALQLVNATALFAGIPDGLTIPGNIALAVWLGSVSWTLGREATSETARSRA